MKNVLYWIKSGVRLKPWLPQIQNGRRSRFNTIYHREEECIKWQSGQLETIGDEVLKKECKAVTEVTDHTLELIEDMFDTMYSAGGVGLAAPQVGIRKQIVVIDVEDGNQYVLINPVIEEMSGSQTGQEGCLSVPGKAGMVTPSEPRKGTRAERKNGRVCPGSR